MNEIATLVTTTIGLAIILLVCTFLFGFIITDLLKNIKFKNLGESGKKIVSYFSKKDKELD
ncbi:MAG: hypothetical protein KAJ76_05710 [Candidatus Heimdallarchaeota archaeon]|nr:hypothetical protein [Candidatus Heimdallarchaeota archaeon]MCK5184521.1 hypothetical protein [Candidatus Heimdallarchaeota archaeon]MCK5298381.1 hypothetical protein [Candidatus Heimdallarchaeota archaeon]